MQQSIVEPQITAHGAGFPAPLRGGWSDRPVNVCTAAMPALSLEECADVAARAGCQGVELRVDDRYHISLDRLGLNYREVRRALESCRLELSVYSTYYGIEDADAVDALIRVCRLSGVRSFRVTLPVAGDAEVQAQAFEGAVIPSYRHSGGAAEVVRSAAAALRRLEKKARAAGVRALVEIHWGTIMSSFSSAHMLVGGLDPRAVALTLDPANMAIEGREDWKYGLDLVREHVANVHLKNVSWLRDGNRWKWRWEQLGRGMVNWPRVFGLLAQSGYDGMLAIEDFLLPPRLDRALAYLRDSREEVRLLLREAATGERDPADYPAIAV